MNANVNTQINNMVDNKEERQKYIDRVEVLEKVKKLFLIPQIDMMTARQIADFYEDEWEKLYETIAAMLNARYVNPSKIFEKAKLTVE